MLCRKILEKPCMILILMFFLNIFLLLINTFFYFTSDCIIGDLLCLTGYCSKSQSPRATLGILHSGPVPCWELSHYWVRDCNLRVDGSPHWSRRHRVHSTSVTHTLLPCYSLQLYLAVSYSSLYSLMLHALAVLCPLIITI